MDPRVQEAQELFWQVATLRTLAQPPHRVIAATLHRMARLHEERAKDLLGRQNVDGWIDLFAAITAWGEAGSDGAARSLLSFGRQAAQQSEGRDSLLAELDSLDRWLAGLVVVPALQDFARPLPRFEAAA